MWQADCRRCRWAFLTSSNKQLIYNLQTEPNESVCQAVTCFHSAVPAGGGFPGGGADAPDLGSLMAMLGGGPGGPGGAPQPVANPEEAFATQLTQLEVGSNSKGHHDQVLI